MAILRVVTLSPILCPETPSARCPLKQILGRAQCELPPCFWAWPQETRGQSKRAGRFQKGESKPGPPGWPRLEPVKSGQVGRVGGAGTHWAHRDPASPRRLGGLEGMGEGQGTWAENGWWGQRGTKLWESPSLGSWGGLQGRGQRWPWPWWDGPKAPHRCWP